MKFKVRDATPKQQKLYGNAKPVLNLSTGGCN